MGEGQKAVSGNKDNAKNGTAKESRMEKGIAKLREVLADSPYGNALVESIRGAKEEAAESYETLTALARDIKETGSGMQESVTRVETANSELQEALSQLEVEGKKGKDALPLVSRILSNLPEVVKNAVEKVVQAKIHPVEPKTAEESKGTSLLQYLVDTAEAAMRIANRQKDQIKTIEERAKFCGDQVEAARELMIKSEAKANQEEAKAQQSAQQLEELKTAIETAFQVVDQKLLLLADVVSGDLKLSDVREELEADSLVLKKEGGKDE